ncbi:hypothetical protein [Bacillus gobiensis]|uniref:hypothetical protein n=1 Tax=Bacillus gobiensis TaxID=1441095 RepID=UPI003D20CB40
MSVPVIELEYGKKLTEKEAKVFFEQNVETNEEFQQILAEAQKENKTENEVEILAANKVEYPVEEGVTFITKLVVKIGEVVINYQLSTKDDVSQEHVMGASLSEEGKVTSIIVNQGEIETTVFDYDGELERDFTEGLPNNEDYVAGQSLKGIDPQWSFSDLNVCYPFFRHCGKGCGDGGPVGGGTPINSYDNCCRAHDRCWATFGTNDCGCDCQLISCAKRYWYLAPLALHVIVLSYFPVKSTCRC